MPDETPQEAKPKENQEITNIKTYIAEAKQNLEAAKITTEEIQKYYRVFQELKTKLDNKDSGLDAVLNQTQKNADSVVTLKTNAQKDLQDITDAVTNTRKSIGEMETAFTNFTTSKSKIDDEQTGLLAILNKSQDLKTQTEAVKTAADENLAQIKIALSSVQANIQEMTVAHQEFTAIKTKIDDAETGLAVVLTKSQNLKQEIDAVKTLADSAFADIKKFRDESQNYTNEITGFKTQADENTKAIGLLKSQSEDYTNKIVEMYGITTGTTLGNSFNQRKNELGSSENKWFFTLVTSTVVLAIAAMFIYYTSRVNGVVTTTFWYKLTFTSPLIFFVIFATERYSSERNLLEKYAFKAATALALESYSMVLRNNFKEQDPENRILDFVLNSMTTIYKEPFEHKKETRAEMSLGNKLGNLTAGVTKTQEEAVTATLTTASKLISSPIVEAVETKAVEVEKVK